MLLQGVVDVQLKRRRTRGQQPIGCEDISHGSNGSCKAKGDAGCCVKTDLFCVKSQASSQIKGNKKSERLWHLAFRAQGGTRTHTP